MRPWIAALLSLIFFSECVAAKSRVLCWILTTAENAGRCRVIERTWGKHCDKLIFVSSNELPGVNSTVELVPVVPHEGRMNLFPKTLAAWRLVYEKYRDEAEYFYKADDDTFVIVPNLIQYLDFLEEKNGGAWYTGAVLQHEPDSPQFALGGAGYALNKASLMKLGQAMVTNSCLPSEGPEDRLFGACMNNMGLYITSSIDEEGRERMHQLWLEKRFNREEMRLKRMDWWRLKTQNALYGEDCCSRNLVSVHKLNESLLRMYYFAFYQVKR
jgi:glycoprotein-N-acetylgalactosamine 3-beta-galactosyltransferase